MEFARVFRTLQALLQPSSGADSYRIGPAELASTLSPMIALPGPAALWEGANVEVFLGVANDIFVDGPTAGQNEMIAIMGCSAFHTDTGVAHRIGLFFRQENVALATMVAVTENARADLEPQVMNERVLILPPGFKARVALTAAVAWAAGQQIQASFLMKRISFHEPVLYS